jgi:predicted TIM-barrel fold metal-dependent hydrolase
MASPSESVGQIIDFRGRPPARGFLNYFVRGRTVLSNQRLGYETAPSYLEEDMDLFFEEMEQAGITRTVALGRNSPVLAVSAGAAEVPDGIMSNDYLAELVAKHPGQLIAVAGIDISGEVHDPIEETRRCIEGLGMKGIHIEPARTRYRAFYNDRRIYRLYELCDELGVVVVLMTGPMYADNICFDHPSHIQDVARDFPSLRLVAGHGCYPWVTEIVAVAQKHPNVYICPDVYTHLPGGSVYVDAARTTLQDQILFGTAYPYAPLGPSVRAFRGLGLDEAVSRKVFHDNAARVLNLS